MAPDSRQMLPVNIDSFEDLRTENYYYVDKTLLIRDILASGDKTLLFTRPRRFGKTTALSMLRSFFEKADHDTSALFEDTNIERAGCRFMDHQGKYPVIHLSFKDAVGRSSQSIIDGIDAEIRAEYKRHLDKMKATGGMDPDDQDEMRRVLIGDAGESDMARSLRALSYILRKHHGAKPVILIDEYDTPIRRAWTLRHREPDCYEDVVDFMRRLLSATLKDNDNRSYACLTGIERVAKEGGESGLNNLDVFGVLDDEFAEYFGFTHEEVRALLSAYDASSLYEAICAWYQGYRFGNVEMFNPVSVLSCLARGGKVRSYWSLTSMNDTIGDALDCANAEVIGDMSRLLVPGGIAQSVICDTLAYPALSHSQGAIFTLLLSTGYLTPAREQLPPRDGRKRELTLEIPNNEVREAYEEKILSRINDAASSDLMKTYAQLRGSMLSGDADGMRTAIEEVLLLVLGPNDIGGKKKEDAYHMLLTGLLGPLMGGYVLASNGNAGRGRFDISLTPLNLGNPAIVIEVKAEDSRSDEELKKLANTALRQIDSKRYFNNPYWTGAGTVYEYGVAFSRKSVHVAFGERKGAK